MALIKCKECNKEYSDTVASCPHCGYVRTDNQEQKQLASEIFRERSSRNDLLNTITYWLIIITVVGGLLFVLFLIGIIGQIASKV